MYMGELQTDATGATKKTIPDEQLEPCIENIASRSGFDYDPTEINVSLTHLKLPAETANPVARTTTYCAHVLELLETAGIKDFSDDITKQAVSLLPPLILTESLCSKTFHRITFEATLEESVPKHIAKLKSEAI